MDFIKGYIDITNSWLSTICKGEYKELKKGDYFYYNNVLYFIDEKNVTTIRILYKNKKINQMHIFLML